MLCGFTKQYGTLYSDNLHYILYIYIAQYSVSTVLIISSLQLILSLKHKPLPLFFSRSLPCSLSPPLSHYLAYTFHYTHSYIYYSPLYVHLWLSFSDLHCSNRIHYLLTSLSLSLDITIYQLTISSAFLLTNLIIRDTPPASLVAVRQTNRSTT